MTLLADLLRGFTEAVIVRALIGALPPDRQVTGFRMYPKGHWSIDWSEP